MPHRHRTRRPAHRAFVLRIWRTIAGCWRASLYDPKDDHRLLFSDPGQLQAFLDRLPDGATPPIPRLAQPAPPDDR